MNMCQRGWCCCIILPDRNRLLAGRRNKVKCSCWLILELSFDIRAEFRNSIARKHIFQYFSQCKVINTWKTAINRNYVFNFHHAENTPLSHYKNQSLNTVRSDAPIFQKSRSHLKTQGARRVTWKKKIKFNLEQWNEFPRVGVVVQLYYFFNRDTRKSGYSTPRPDYFNPGQETRYPFYRMLGEPQSRSGWHEAKFYTEYPQILGVNVKNLSFRWPGARDLYPLFLVK